MQDKDYVIKLIKSSDQIVRAQKVKRVPGTSGRLHKTEDGGWEWSDEELDPRSDSALQALQSRSRRVNEQQSASGSLSSQEASNLNAGASGGEATTEQRPISLILRLRNEKRELHDVKFDFLSWQDTSDSVARELVEAGLVDGHDLIVVAANLAKITEKPYTGRHVVFALSASLGSNEMPDDKLLVGFAQLSVADIGAPIKVANASDASN